MLNPLFAGYPASHDSFDEMLDDSRQPRAHWRTLLDTLARETPDVMRGRTKSVRQQVRENGATYNVYADDKGTQRVWDLNVLPMILPHEEWPAIEAAVVQRATLMNRLLIDVYGEQKMLAEKLLPPALVHGHAGFLRPCHDLQHLDGIALHFYAVDLARAPNGRWWVVADRTQAPSGAGYALENRSVISRTFPDLLRELKVQHLTGFFDTLRDSLAGWGRQCAASGNRAAPLRDSEPPLIVLLTPGPFNETYYEQAYLARHLGLPLVEGSDLTVRNGMVWLKTLSSLQRVHVIMRRVDDDYCDPLELRADSALGVAGLTEAARSGNVLIANSLGSNLLESGALLGFLPRLCKRLLGEPLKMPSVATWWCGEPAALEQVVKWLDQLVVKPAFPQLRQFPVFGTDLKGDERTAFIAKMRASPKNYVAQELVRLSQAPVWKPGAAGGLNGLNGLSGLQSSAIGLRVYACATPLGYVVMPGGLTRVATGADSRIITMQRGGGSKDTWVQASAPVETHSQLKRTITSQELVRDDTHLSSRVAENLFWFGRNAERCDNTARLLRVALNFLLNVGPTNCGDEWPTTLELCAWFGLVDQKSKDQSQGRTTYLKPLAVQNDMQIEAALLRAVASPDVPGLARQQQQLYGCASQLRERFSRDNWRALNQMVQRVSSSTRQPTPSEAMMLLDNAAAFLMTLSGFALDGMTRDLGWRFLSLGRRLERLQFQALALQHALRMKASGSLDWLLELSDSIITYRARYRAQPQWLPVLDLLLLDESNTRSILFQLEGILQSVQKISLTYGPCGGEELDHLKTELLSLVPDADLYGGNARLVNLLHRIELASADMSTHVSRHFFSYTGPHQAQSA